jgi:hypothetical protein
MRTRFVSQPFDDGFDLRDFVLDTTDDLQLIGLDIVVAWAKRSGLRLVEGALRAFRQRGGVLRIVLGISEGGATRQGLEMAMELADSAYVFHNPGGRTFHPKVYFARGDGRARLLVGSHNLTRGGAIENYEAGIVCDLDLTDPEEDRVADAVTAYFDRLLNDSAVCKRLDAELLALLVSDPRYRVADEDVGQPGRSPSDVSSIDTDNQVGAADGSIFGRSRLQLRSAPSAGGAAPPHPRPRGSAGHTSAAAARPTAAAPEMAKVVKRWHARLSAAAAQRPGPRSSPTGYLSLGKAGHPIDARTYFRDDFFKTAQWIGQPGERETTTVAFDVFVVNEHVGSLNLVVDYVPAFEAGQGNRTTLLRWGDWMNEHFRTVDHIGAYVTVERLSDDSFRLTIGESPTGPFKP